MNRKVVFLTIDDAPSSFMKEKIDTLWQANIPAIWYLRGEFIEKHSKDVLYAIEKGFWIGNHSFSHPHFSSISLEEAKKEIVATEELIDNIYCQSGRERGAKLFRFPFMDDGKECSLDHQHKLQCLLREMGFSTLYFEGIALENPERIDAVWTFDAKEWALFSDALQKKHNLASIDDFTRRMKQKLFQNVSHEIVLFHDFETTHHLFAPLIEALIQEGVEFALPKIFFKTDNHQRCS